MVRRSSRTFRWCRIQDRSAQRGEMMLVAIVDDDADLAGRMATDVEDAGFDASIVTLSSGQTIDVTIGQMRAAGGEPVFWAHGLQHRVTVPFAGGRLVAPCTNARY